MVAILKEPAYSESMWCKKISSGLTKRLRQKRIPFCEVYDTIPAGCETVFMIAAELDWIRSVLNQLNQAEIVPILLCNQASSLPGFRYSCVCSDVDGSMKELLERLKNAGKTRVALYGVNPSSISDVGRVDGLFAQKDDAIDSMRIFVNNGSLEACYREFSAMADRFDAVVCFNDFAAVSLLRHLEADGAADACNRLMLFSCSETRISSCYRDRITSLNMQLEQYGKAAVLIYEQQKANPYLSQLTLRIRWNVPSRQEPRSAPVCLTDLAGNDLFYEDRELNEMMIAERILETDSAIDKAILERLVRGATVSEIADACYLTESGVKYRMQKILEFCKVPNKAELLSILRRYLPAYGKGL